MDILSNVFVDMIATLVGIFIGTLAAMAADRYNERRRNRHRAVIILRSLLQELDDNDEVLQSVEEAYYKTPWGKSFYISTIAWETALASGDLPAIIGSELTDILSVQYGLIVQIRYYVGLLTQLWFAPAEIQGYEQIREGLRQAILEVMGQAIKSFPDIVKEIEQALEE